MTSPAERGHVRTVDATRLSHGLYWRPRWPDSPLDELRAWQLVLPRTAAFSHLTAARVFGWWLPGPIDHPVFVAQSSALPRARRDGLFVCRHPKDFPMILHQGVRLTTAAETLLACSRDLGVLDLVVLGDSALRNRDCTVVDLWDAARRRRRGAPMLRRVIPLLDRRSESPWESIMRVLHKVAEISVTPQFEVRDVNGHFLARGDLRINGTRRLHEYDGDIHRERSVHADDLTRHRLLVAAGWERIGFTKNDLLLDYRRIIDDADRLLGREWSRDRVEGWRELVTQSLFDVRFRARAHDRWRQEHLAPAESGHV